MSGTERQDAVTARYGEEAARAVAEGPWNDVIAALLAHRTVRAFRPEPMPSR